MENYSLRNYSAQKGVKKALEEGLGRTYNEQDWGIGFAKTNIAQGHFGFTCVEMKVLGNLSTNELIVYRQIQNTVVGKIGVENFVEIAESLDEVNDIIINKLLIKDPVLINNILTDVQSFQNWKENQLPKENNLKLA